MIEKELLKLSKKAAKNGDFPVAAIIIRNNKVIAKAYNKKEYKKNAIYHAEIIAIQKACKKIKTWRLDDCEMYITMEPCLMCYGAITQSRIKKINYYYENDKFGFTKNYKESNSYKNVNYEKIKPTNREYSKLIKSFFLDKRNREKY